MTRALLDVNVLLALLDRDHVHHDTAREWLLLHRADGWASCAITQNGYVRIASQPSYPQPISTAAACRLLATACANAAHEFWPCDVSTLDPQVVRRDRILTAGQLTDIYLLALAVRHGGRLVTFDRTMPVNAVVGATDEHLVVL